jgi:hypothetical protein
MLKKIAVKFAKIIAKAYLIVKMFGKTGGDE